MFKYFHFHRFLVTFRKVIKFQAKRMMQVIFTAVKCQKKSQVCHYVSAKGVLES